MTSGAKIIGGRGAFARSPGIRQARFAAALALTRTAQDIQGATRKMLETKLENPSRWTLNGVAVMSAQKDRLTAAVYFREWAGKGVAAGTYLRHMETGGQRRQKRFEAALRNRGILHAGQFVMPADGGSIDLRGLDGKNSGALYQRILSGLQANWDATQDQTPASIRRKRRKGRFATQYWIQTDPETHFVKAIWERVSAKEARPVLIVVDHARYGATLDFQGLAARTFAERWPVRMAEAWDRALATAR